MNKQKKEKEYIVTAELIQPEVVGIMYVTAKSKKEALKKAKEGQYNEMDYDNIAFSGVDWDTKEVEEIKEIILK